MNKKIAQVAIGLPVEGPFDYSIGKELQDCIAIGQRVRILFNRRKRVGFVVGFKKRSSFKNLNPILAVLDQSPSLSDNALMLTKKISEYSRVTVEEILNRAIEIGLRDIEKNIQERIRRDEG